MKPRAAILLAAGAAAACSVPSERAPAALRATVEIDFGADSARAPRTREVLLPPGSTVLEATHAAAAVEEDWLCCSPRDVWAIDGLGPDPSRDLYWFWHLGDEVGPRSAHEHVLAAGDRIRWTHRRSTREPAGPPPRVVSLLPAGTEILRAVGAERGLVGVSHLCRLSAASAGVPRLVRTPLRSEEWDMRTIDAEVRALSAARQPLYEIDVERLRELQPDVLITQGLCPVCAPTPGDLDASGGERACAHVLTLSPHSLADVAEDIRRVGAAVGRAGAGKVAARIFEKRIEAARARLLRARREPAPTVAVLEWFDPLWLSGDWITEMVAVAGGRPAVVLDGEPSRKASWEELAAADPEVLVLAPCAMGIERARRELPALLGRGEWRRLSAVRGARVFLLDGEACFSAPGPGLARGVELLAEILADPDGCQPRGADDWVRIVPEVPEVAGAKEGT